MAAGTSICPGSCIMCDHAVCSNTAGAMHKKSSPRGSLRIHSVVSQTRIALRSKRHPWPGCHVQPCRTSGDLAQVPLPGKGTTVLSLIQAHAMQGMAVPVSIELRDAQTAPVKAALVCKGCFCHHCSHASRPSSDMPEQTLKVEPKKPVQQLIMRSGDQKPVVEPAQLLSVIAAQSRAGLLAVEGHGQLQSVLIWRSC